MNRLTVLGVLLVLTGISLLVFNGFSYKTQENVADIGPLKINAEKENYIPFSPLAGGALMIGGGILLWSATRKG